MPSKKIDKGLIENALNRFLENKNSLIFGFETGEDGISHQVFKEKIGRLSLFNPVFSVNSALHLRRIFSKGTKIALILRPCEIRAYIELIKLNQIEKEDVTAISVDCLGAVSLKKMPDDIPLEPDRIMDYFKGSDIMRWACRVCREKRGIVGDAGIRIDKNGGLWAVSYTDKGDEFLTFIEGDRVADPPEMLLEPNKGTERFFSDTRTFSKDVSRCIMCKNCRDMCPVCYCIDCVFNGDEYLPKGDALLNKILRSGPLQLPQGKELFHFVRMYHVSQTCVGCGACEEACPQEIPLTKYFKGISERLQGMFSYMSGRSFDEAIPYLTFLEDELKDAED